MWHEHYLQQASNGSISEPEQFFGDAAVLHACQVDLLERVEADAVVAGSGEADAVAATTATGPGEARLLEEEIADRLGEELQRAKRHAQRVAEGKCMEAGKKTEYS